MTTSTTTYSKCPFTPVPFNVTNTNCANCDTKFVDQNGNDKITQFIYNTQTVTNFEALKLVFQAEFLLKWNIDPESSLEKRGQADNHIVITLCYNCTIGLANLYNFYLEFVNLSGEASTLQGLIKRTLNWIAIHQESCSSTSGKNKFEDISISQTYSLQEEVLTSINQGTEVKHEPSNTQLEDLAILPDTLDNDKSYEDAFSANDSHDSNTNAGLKKTNYSISTKTETLSVGESKQNEALSKKLSVRVERLNIEKLRNGGSFSARNLINQQRQRKRTQLLIKNQSTTSKSKTCPLCSKICKTIRALNQHMRVHSNERNYACSDCTKSYKNQKDLNRHQNVKHGVGGQLPDRTCHICGRYFGVPHLLQTHIKSVHATDKPFSCEICARTFPTYNYLNIHKKMRHDEKRDYKCDECGKILTTKPGLQAHKDMVHLKEKRFSCEKCAKRFYRLDWLNEHMKTHEPNREKTFKCQYCGAMFHSKSIVRNHEKKHVIGFYILCADCGASFKNKSSLDRHIQSRHTDGVGYACPLCAKVFKVKEYLTQHMRSKTHGGLGHYSERLKEGTTTRVIPKIEPVLLSGDACFTNKPTIIPNTSSTTSVLSRSALVLEEIESAEDSPQNTSVQSFVLRQL